MDPQTSDFSDFVGALRHTVEVAGAKLLEITEAESRIPRAAGKWSPKQIVGHLIDSASNNHQRFVRAQFRDDLHFPGYRQEEWLEVQHYNDEPWPQLVQLWKHYNLHLVHVMAAVPADKLSTLRRIHNLDEIASVGVAKSEPATLEYFIRDYVVHLNHHLRQIFEPAAKAV
jgi:DinB superfamily